MLEGLKLVDWFGSITVLASTVMLLSSLELGGVTFPWSSPELIGLVTVGMVLLGLFFLNEAKFAKQPVVPMRLFQKQTTAALLLVVLLHGLVSYRQATFITPTDQTRPMWLQCIISLSIFRLSVEHQHWVLDFLCSLLHSPKLSPASSVGSL